MSKHSSSKKTNAARILDEMKIEYDVLEYEIDEDDMSAEAAAKSLELPQEQVFKTLVVRGDKTGVIMACLPAGAELSLKALAHASGNKSAELVHVKELQPLTGYIRGGCSPLGTKKKYPVYIHSSAEVQAKIAVNAGSRGILLYMAPGDLIKATSGHFAEVSR